MATIERFKQALARGGVPAEGKMIPLTPQMRYDYLSAIHTMEQLLKMSEEITKRNEQRDKLTEKISTSCKLALKKIVESDEPLTVKIIDSAIQGLRECRNELVKIDAADKEADKLAECIRDGISAGR